MTDLLTFARQLRAAYCRETSELPDLWYPANPSIGQCHVTALCLQWRLGGHILEGDFCGTRHYWSLIDRIMIDPTIDQFNPLGGGRLRIYGLAPAPLQVTLDKAAVLAELARKAAAA